MECGITEEEEDDRFEIANFKLAGKYPISPALPAVGRAGRPDAFPLPIKISIIRIWIFGLYPGSDCGNLTTVWMC